MYRLIPIKNKVIRVCFSGHRNIYGYNWETTGNKTVFQRLLKTVEEYILTSGYNTFIFITGGALLIDQMSATIVLYLRKKYKKLYRIILIIAVPYAEQPKIWKPKDQRRYTEHLKLADDIIFVDTVKKYACNKVNTGSYHKDKLVMRNKFMLNNSDIVINIQYINDIIDIKLRTINRERNID